MQQAKISAELKQPKIEATIQKASQVYEKDYEKLSNLPQINDVTLKGNKSIEDLGVTKMLNADVLRIYNLSKGL